MGPENVRYFSYDGRGKRDEQTAATATRAANTGNLVLATTHATRASRAVETMLSLGAHPYFLAPALRGVVA